jgi:FAD/FMN-containing dehydrogenase
VDSSLRSRLSEAVGAKAVDSRTQAVSPASADEVARVCRICAETATRLAVTSSAPGDSSVAGAAVTVSLARLDGVEARPGSLTLRAGAGADIAAVLAAARAVGLAPLGVRRGLEGSPVGSLVARGAVPRRALSGIEAVLTTGETVRAGGAVLKDVAGYDLVGLLCGSAGRLALITAVTFRLLPAGSSPAPPEDAARRTAGELSDLIRSAFDPAGLLRPA